LEGAVALVLAALPCRAALVSRNRSFGVATMTLEIDTGIRRRGGEPVGFVSDFLTWSELRFFRRSLARDGSRICLLNTIHCRAQRTRRSARVARPGERARTST